MQEKKDLNWVNVAKAISIITVFFVHTEIYYGLKLGSMNSLLCGYYVNAFFMISGYLLFRKQLSKPSIDANISQYSRGGGIILMSNILYRIYIPMVFFSMIEFLPKIAIAHRTFYINDFIIETVGAGTYWFTSALMIAEIFIAILLISRSKNVWFYIIILGIMSSIGMYLFDIGVFYFHRESFFVSRGILAFFFLGLGALYWKYESKFDKYVNKYSIMPLVVVCLYLAYNSSITPKYMVSMGDMNVLGYLYGFLISIILFWFCKHLPEIKLMTFIGRNSICFYFMSGALPITLSSMIKIFIPGENIMGLLVIFILTLFLSYIATMIIVRYLPWMLDIRKLKNAHVKNSAC